ncbi:hypothetical protein ACQCVP_22110 [Rossellomorea vietnamensis]|uniref:hypothetical protein n=1 Tax=Rossellomorea vietnamensis TaxID=218284 RepID=UPI003CF9DC69
MKSSTKNQPLSDHLSKNREKLKEDVLLFYSESIPDILEALYDTAYFEKEIRRLEPLFESPFHYRFIEFHGMNLFFEGFLFSLYSKANLLDDYLREDLSEGVKTRLDAMTEDAGRLFNEAEVECFTLTAYKIFEFGTIAGKDYSF